MREFRGVKKILVIKLRHIGDVLLTVPVFRALREKFPDAHIAALVNSGTEDVLTGNTLIDDIITFDRGIKKINPAQKYFRELSFIKEIRMKKFDMAIDLTGGDRPAIISLLSGAKYRFAHSPVYSGFWRKSLYTHLAKRDFHKHTVLQNLDVIGEFGITTNNTAVDIFIPEDARRFAKKIFDERGIAPGNKIVHIHPTSRWLFKCVSNEYMAEVIKWLIEKGIYVIVTSSPDKIEMEKTKRILSLVGDSPPMGRNPRVIDDSRIIDLCGKTNIKELAAVSSMSNLFIGVDSAPMHIAAAVGTPVIALFGPTGAYNWGPCDNRILNFKSQISNFENPYPQKNGIQKFGIHAVIQKDWDCVPCGMDGCNKTKVSRCLEEITPREMIEVIADKLENRGRPE
jgi:heptosyltransferase-3